MPKQNKIGKQSSSVSTAFNVSSDEQVLFYELDFILNRQDDEIYNIIHVDADNWPQSSYQFMIDCIVDSYFIYGDITS